MQVSTRKEPHEGECVAMELVRPEHKTRLEIPQEPAARSHYPCEDGGAKGGECSLSPRAESRWKLDPYQVFPEGTKATEGQLLP